MTVKATNNEVDNASHNERDVNNNDIFVGTEEHQTQGSAADPLNENVTVFTSFEQMNLNHALLRGVYSYGFERPSAIQQRAIVPIALGHDTLAQAQSGTGKTATFAIGMLQRVDVSIKKPQGLILAPTRELAEQIRAVVGAIGENLGVICKACIGGTNVRADIAAVESGTHIIVGTPGRVLDLINRHAFDPYRISMFTLDEADEMLSRGFKDQIYDIFQTLNHNQIQVSLISATIPNEVRDVASKFMRNPVEILVKNDELTLEGINQYFIPVAQEQEKFGALCDLYEAVQVSQSVIFCNSISRVDGLAKRLTELNFAVSFVHGDMSQVDRSNVVNDFRAGKTRMLISTDLLARGIDVQQVSVVINYDIPPVAENYLHRIGRGGRFGRKGVALNFVDSSEKPILEGIEKYYDTHIVQAPSDLARLIGS